jgi:hypothetical protein
MLHSIRPINTSATGKVKRRVKAASIVSLVGVLGILLAACSSGSANASGSGSTSTTSGGSTSASFTAYENCLKSHGVTFSPGDFRPGGGAPPAGSTSTTLSPSERTKFEQANTACASLRPKFNGAGTGAASTAFAAYRNCLKLHGVTLPTGRGAGGFGFGGGSSTSTTSNPKTQAALTACAALRPKGGFGGRGFPGGTTTTTS